MRSRLRIRNERTLSAMKIKASTAAYRGTMRMAAPSMVRRAPRAARARA
jgi:hypothetical protein